MGRIVFGLRSKSLVGFSLIIGAGIVGALLGGCGEEALMPLGDESGGTGGQGATGSNTTAGSGNSGSMGTGAQSAGGTTENGAGTAASAGDSGTAGAGGGAGSGGATGGAGSGTAGNGGSAGSGASVCPAGGSGGTAVVDDPTGDADSDGTPNCLDACPRNSAKTEPGGCGCAKADVDTDGDGTFDCNDACPNDPAKVAEGVCGCGVSDTANADGDAAVDCQDECPNDAARTTGGTCGCLPDALGALCLAHRYQFEGTGTVVADSIAGDTGSGTVVGATLSGAGTLVLAGGATDQYVTLPSKLISAMGNSATFEAWVTWAGGGGDWQRVFDFGASSGGDGMQGYGRSYLFLTPRANTATMRVAISASGNSGGEDMVMAAAALPTTLTHVAVVLDGAARTLKLYQNGVSQGATATVRPGTTLSALKDVNNWLGRSQYQNDEELAGTYHEVRLYSRALSAAEVTATFTAGPDALP